jgi:hypothetical protein
MGAIGMTAACGDSLGVGAGAGGCSTAISGKGTPTSASCGGGVAAGDGGREDVEAPGEGDQRTGE